MAADQEQHPRRIGDDDLERFERAFQDALEAEPGGADVDVELAHLPDELVPAPRPARRRTEPASAEPGAPIGGPELEGILQSIARLEERLARVEEAVETMANRRHRMVQLRARPVPEADAP